jgi:hypothetical protein
MKATKFVNLIAVGLALAFVSTGCKNKPVYQGDQAQHQTSLRREL